MAHKIFGIDPGSRTTGYALLIEENGSYRAEVCDVIRMDKMDDHNERLQFIFDEISKLVKEHKPDQCAVETPVYGVDPLAMLKLGRAQAAAILAITNLGVPVSEYYPKAVKKAITGNGNASKKQVAFMLDRMMKLPDHKLSDDATDALAVAWCHHTKTGKIAGASSPQKMHQNNSKSGWASFVANNPDRVKKH
ncbi:MAG: crossover junction endodeoxyribonuclease RuvC [Balneolaceae bacterium]|nr:crossover junction endodeoxyribonuclease RuvC [Balneolaceae bacterium]MCH8548732.1 crossover junction endodeoxyribonuclease RuvC [Balneolaceae bacterium]